MSASFKRYFSTITNQWINPATGRKSQSNQSEVPPNANDFIIGLLDQATDTIDKQFQDKFLYGVKMEMWRKGNIKEVYAFIDQQIPNFLWISTKTKAFLIDLAYTEVHHFNHELEEATKAKKYLILKSFEEEIPIIFREQIWKEEQIYYYHNLLTQYTRFCRIRNRYSPSFSRILKLFTMEEIKDKKEHFHNTVTILDILERIGLSQRKEARNILQAIYQEKEKKDFSDKSKFSHEQLFRSLKLIQCAQQLVSTFLLYSGGKIDSCLDYLEPMMDKAKFKNFLKEEQKEKEEDCQKILSQTKDKISFFDFCSYLQDANNNYAASSPAVNEHLPLTDYFCFSSHNTYLTGNQLTSDSSIDRYIEDLSVGLKCVEIDVHNDGSRPIITHAFQDRGFCKSIDFEETIKQISKYCQSNPNHYPIILSIENHASQQNRYKVHDILFKYFSPKLLLDIGRKITENQGKIGTLFELMGKVIIKTDCKIDNLPNHYNLEHLVKRIPSKISFQPSKEEVPTQGSSDFLKRQAQFLKMKGELKERKNRFFSSIPYLQFFPVEEMIKVTGMFKSPNGINKNSSCGFQCTSLTNEQVGKRKREDLLCYTKRSWLRTYPVATQIKGDNYEPMPLLSIGAQIIAVNTQIKDNHSMLLRSYFTGGRNQNVSKIGYVEKPLHLRSSQPYNPSKKIYSIIPLSNRKVNMQFYGNQEDQRMNEGDSVKVFQVKHFEEGFIMFTIDEELRDCIPLRFINSGIRVLIGRDEEFLDTGVRILVRISIGEE